MGVTSSTVGMPAIIAFNGSNSGGDGLDAWNSSSGGGAAIVAEALSTGGNQNKGPSALVLKIHSPYATGISLSSDYSSSTVQLIQSPGFTVDGTGAVSASSLNLSGTANVGIDIANVCCTAKVERTGRYRAGAIHGEAG